MTSAVDGPASRGSGEVPASEKSPDGGVSENGAAKERTTATAAVVASGSAARDGEFEVIFVNRNSKSTKNKNQPQT